MSVDPPKPCRFVILISGRGSNMQSIVEQAKTNQWPANFVRVISNQPDAPGLAWAKSQGIDAVGISHRDFPSREAFDERLAELVEQAQPDYVLLAGFMRILTTGFVNRFAGRLINIHPSLLPAFPGLKTHAQALAAGVGWHGCTVHFVTDQLDLGPIIAQAALPVHRSDSEQSLADRVLELEHQLYPQVVHWLAQNRVLLASDGKVQVQGVEYPHIWQSE